MINEQHSEHTRQSAGQLLKLHSGQAVRQVDPWVLALKGQITNRCVVDPGARVSEIPAACCTVFDMDIALTI